MDGSPCLEVEAGCAVFRPSGHVTLHEAVAEITAAIAWAREQQIRKLLVVTSGWTGLRSPDLAARYFFVEQWARAAAGAVRVAMVARPEMVDSEKFGVTVARNFGFRADVFTSEEEALSWLRGDKTTDRA